MIKLELHKHYYLSSFLFLLVINYKMKSSTPIAALAPHWPDGPIKARCRPSGNLDLVYSICLGGSEILKIMYPANLKSKS